MTLPTRAPGPLRAGRRQQHGNGLLYAMLGMAIVSVYLAALMARNQDQRVFESGAMEGAIAKNIAGAATAYITEYYPQIVDGITIEKKNSAGTTTHTVDAAKVRAPTVADLAGLGYLTAGTNDKATFIGDKITGVNRYAISIQTSPAGCTTTSATAFCDLTGLVYLVNPVMRRAGTEINDPWIAGWLKETGANGGYSHVGSEANIAFPSSPASNPTVPNLAGIVAMRFGYNASGNNGFVRMHETRAVELLNTLVVGPAIPASAPASAPRVTVRQGDVSVQDGGVAAKLDVTAQRNVTAKFDVTADGNVIATGNIKGNQIVPTGSFVPGTACTNPGALANANNSPLPAIGWVACQNGKWVAIATVANAGDACSTNYAEATATTDGQKLICLNNKYVNTSDLFQADKAGALCTIEGQQGYDITDPSKGYRQMICRRNPDTAYVALTGSPSPLLWYRLHDLTSFKEFIFSKMAIDGEVIQKPSCGPVGDATRKAIIDFAGAGAAGSADGSFGYTEMAIESPDKTYWTMSLKDGTGITPLTSTKSDGTPAKSQKQVLVYCYTY